MRKELDTINKKRLEAGGEEESRRFISFARAAKSPNWSGKSNHHLQPQMANIIYHNQKVTSRVRGRLDGSGGGKNSRQTLKAHQLLANLLKLVAILAAIQWISSLDFNAALVSAVKAKGLIYNKDGKFIYKPSRWGQSHIIVIDDRSPAKETSGNKNNTNNETNRSSSSSSSSEPSSPSSSSSSSSSSSGDTQNQNQNHGAQSFYQHHPSSLRGAIYSNNPMAASATNGLSQIRLINLNELQGSPGSAGAALARQQAALMSSGQQAAAFQLVPVPISMYPTSGGVAGGGGVGGLGPRVAQDSGPFGYSFVQQSSAPQHHIGPQPGQQGSLHQNSLNDFDSPAGQLDTGSRSWNQVANQMFGHQQRLVYDQDQHSSTIYEHPLAAFDPQPPPDMDEPAQHRNNGVFGQHSAIHPHHHLSSMVRSPRSSASGPPPLPVHDLEDVEGGRVDYFDDRSRPRPGGPYGGGSHAETGRPGSATRSSLSPLDDGGPHQAPQAPGGSSGYSSANNMEGPNGKRMNGDDQYLAATRNNNIRSGRVRSNGMTANSSSNNNKVATINGNIAKKPIDQANRPPTLEGINDTINSDGQLGLLGSKDPRSNQYWKQFRDQYDIV